MKGGVYRMLTENRPLGAGKIDTRYFVEYGYVPHIG